jgi:superfamily II DNA or RNA helicase
MKYSDIKDDNFYKKINTIYKDFKIPKKKKTFEEFCFPKSFKPQMPQLMLSKYINPKTPYKGVLVYHRIGAGKTCTAVKIAEEWKHYRNIIVVVPASLKYNFRNELRSMCAENNYLTEKERKLLQELHPSSKEYKDIIEKSDKRIDQYYQIYSYNKFLDLVKEKKLKLNNSILIIDEVQNMISEEGTYYNTLYNLIQKSPSDLRIVLLSATPMYDKPVEIALTLNLLNLPKEIPTGNDFIKKFIKATKMPSGKITYDVKNMDLFKSMIKGYVSFFKGAPNYVFPEMKIKFVHCEMSKFQLEAYNNILKYEEKNTKPVKPVKILTVKNMPNNFFIGTRMISNIAFPNNKMNEDGYKSLKKDVIKNKINKYSCKFAKIIEKIMHSSGKIFVYSNFKEYGGLRTFAKVLDAFGYKNYLEHGEGPKRYAIWSGDEDIKTKDEIKSVYNQTKNLNGSKIKILLGSSSIAEGVSLTGVRQVHIIDPTWNRSRLSQIIGRASRFCSHKDLPEEKRKVKVYIYLAVHNKVENSVDEYINFLATQKDKLIQRFETAVREASIDCELFKNANVESQEEDIDCVK